MSDPSKELSRAYDEKEGRPFSISKPSTFGYGEWISPKQSLVHIKESEEPKFASKHMGMFEELALLKDQFEGPKFQAARDAANPFEKIGNSIFANRAAIKLANTDAVFNLTCNMTPYQPKSDKPFVFVDVAAGPGAFTQYIQWRLPNSVGYGMTLVGDLDWDLNIIDGSRFTAEYGRGGRGDLYVEGPDFVSLIANKGGADLVTGDGGFDITEKDQMRMQEFISSRLFLAQVLVGIGATKVGGHFVCKVFDTLTLFSFQTIYLLSQCFDEICMFKPISSRPANAERYIVCKSRLDTDRVDVVYDLVKKVLASYKPNHLIESMFKEKLPAVFTAWLDEQNKASLDRQMDTTIDILERMKQKKFTQSEYWLGKVYSLWSIPGPQVNKKSIFK
jgi:FtsJ-like methyltransferase